MPDRSNRNQGGSQSQSGKEQGQGGRSGHSESESERRPGRHSQGNPDQPRDEKGHFEGGRSGQERPGKSSGGSGSGTGREDEEQE